MKLVKKLEKRIPEEMGILYGLLAALLLALS